jgi:2-hydroxychromene-2-carboxylate isomerase
MSKTLKFLFDFTCPYAYLASTRVEALAERTGAEPSLYWGNDRLELAARASRGVERAG